MTVDHGMVWLAFGNLVVQFDPTTGTPKHWVIPDLTDVIVPIDPGEDGKAVAVTVSGGQVYVGVNSAKVVEVLDPTTGRWTSMSSKPVVPVGDSGLVVTSRGVVLMSGVLAGTSTPGLVAIRNGIPVASTVSAVALAARPDGKAAYRDASGNVGILDSAGTPTTVAAKAAPAGAVTDALAASVGADWTWTKASGHEEFKRVADDGTVSAYQFVFHQSPCNGTCEAYGLPGAPKPTFTPTALVEDPWIQGGIVDSNGNLWVALQDNIAPYYSAVMELNPT